MSDLRSAHPGAGPIARRLFLGAVLALALAGLYTLARGEVRTGFHRACLTRFTDMQGYARHRLEGTVDDTHPLFGTLVRRNRTLLPAAVVGLTRAGLPFEVSVALLVVLVRAAFGAGLAWLVLAATGRMGPAAAAALLAFSLAPDPTVYGYTASLAIAGMATVSLFLGGAALWILGRRRLALLLWLLQAWVHPITAACWAPVAIGLALSERFGPDRRLRLARVWLALLVLGPLAAGLGVAIAERRGWLGPAVEPGFWDLVRTRLMHTVFLGSARYQLPLQYLGAVAALAILAAPGAAPASPLRRLNALCAALGGGLWLAYLALVETEQSTILAACLPLRFESVLIPLLLANAFEAATGEHRSPAERLLSAAYGVALILFVFGALTWAWLWALALVWVGRPHGAWRRLGGAALGGAAVVVAYMLLAPDDTGRLVHRVALTLDAMLGLAALGALLAVGLGVRHFDRRSGLAVLLCAVLLLARGTWDLDRLYILKAELVALARGEPERSPQKEVADWLTANIGPGRPALTHPDLPLHLVTPLRVSVNDDLPSLLAYVPDQARPLRAEIESIYGLDVAALARSHRRLPEALRGAWSEARDRCLRGSDYACVVEPASVAPSGSGRILFENPCARVYAPAAAQAAGAMSGKG